MIAKQPPVRDSSPVTPAFVPISALDLMDAHDDLRPVVIQDLLREGEVMNIVAAPKVGKSWLVHALAVAVSSGRPWLGNATTQARVLLIDAELHAETLAMRLGATYRMMHATLSDATSLDVWPLRGQRIDVDRIATVLAAKTSPRQYGLIVLDALYRFMPLNAEENSNEAMTRTYNTLDNISKETGAAIVVVHHASKGNQSAKAVTDVGSGAGSQSRAADTHLVLRPHVVEGAVVVEAAVRSFAPLQPFVIRQHELRWDVADDLDATHLRGSRSSKGGTVGEAAKKVPPREWTPKEFADEIVGVAPRIRPDVVAEALTRGIRKGDADSLLKRSLEAGHVHRHIDPTTSIHRFSTVAARK